MAINDHNFYDQRPPIAAATNPVPTPIKPPAVTKRWILSGAAILAVVLAVIFLLAVYMEISSREAQLRSFLKSAETDSAASGAGIKLLSGLSGESIIASSTDNAAGVAALSGEPPAGAKDSVRLLAEKSGRPQTGNPSAGLVIVEFLDFQCPVCLQEFPIIREISNKYAKDVLLIARNYPVIDQNSMMFAQAGLCAEEQGKFWIFHDRLFAAQGQIASLQDFQQVAVMSGLDWNKLQDCVNKEKYQAQVLEDMSDALDLGVRGTPTFFVNGKKLEGAITAAVWEEIIAKYKSLSK